MATGHSNGRNAPAALFPCQARAGGSGHRTGALAPVGTVRRDSMEEGPGAGGRGACGGPVPAGFPLRIPAAHAFPHLPRFTLIPSSPPTLPSLSPG